MVTRQWRWSQPLRMLWSNVACLYSLDTLDARFSPAAVAPATAAAVSASASPAQWETREFWVYYVSFVMVVPFMFKAVIDVSQSSHPSYERFASWLSDGWIGGRKVDNSDMQYAGFRDNVPILLLFLIAHPLLRRVVDAVLPPRTHSPSVSASNSPRLPKPYAVVPAAPTVSNGNLPPRFYTRVRFDYAFGLAFAVLLHGFSVAKILAIFAVNYAIGQRLPRPLVPGVTWAFCIAILLSNEMSDGYMYAGMAERVVRMLPMVPVRVGETLVAIGEWLDGYGGLVRRWEVLFKFSTLRLISFNMDYYWSLDYTSTMLEKRFISPGSLTERDRVSVPAPPEAFSFRTYLAYLLYSPLYLAGPILTFNDYVWQAACLPSSLTPARTARYALRFVLTFLAMELILHYIYVAALANSGPDWDLYTPFELSMLAYFNLHHIWLKLLIPWRLFRLWALVDGVDPPENMVRCVSNNYSALAFWRSWHRSFNRWVVRYLYVPLGGGTKGDSSGSRSGQASESETKGKLPSRLRSTWLALRNLLIVFTFVALWHEFDFRLLAWSWLITIFVLPETLLTLAFSSLRPLVAWRRASPISFRVLCGVGAVGNILLMMTANLVGFAIGVDGLRGLIGGILGSWMGAIYTLAACGGLFIGVQVMFELREEEKRRGVKMKC